VNESTEVLQVYDEHKSKPVASIILNGYNIASGGPLGLVGAMRSFKIVRGNLWESWNRQEALRLRDQTGREARIRVAALPVEEDSTGLIEFL
jgi:hypothetical protein